MTTDPAAPLPGERRRRVAGDGVRLAVREWGWDSGGPGVVLVHGLASSSHIWDLLAGRLGGRLHVVAYDQRSHGESPRPSNGFALSAFVADLRAVVRACHLRRPLVAGHSFGANVAVELAARHPRSAGGLLLIDGGFATMSDRMDWATAESVLRPPEMDGVAIDQLIARIAGGPMQGMWGPAPERLLRSLFSERAGRAYRHLSVPDHMRIVRAMWEQPTRELLAAVRVPVRLVLARPDRPDTGEAGFLQAKRAAAAEIRRRAPSVRVEWMRGVHDLPLQHPAAIANRIQVLAAEGRKL